MSVSHKFFCHFFLTLMLISSGPTFAAKNCDLAAAYKLAHKSLALKSQKIIEIETEAQVSTSGGYWHVGLNRGNVVYIDLGQIGETSSVLTRYAKSYDGAIVAVTKGVPYINSSITIDTYVFCGNLISLTFPANFRPELALPLEVQYEEAKRQRDYLLTSKEIQGYLKKLLAHPK
jgi:hypothetical protein